MKTHPPLFNELTLRLDPHHPVNYLARRIARAEDTGKLHTAIQDLFARRRVFDVASPYRRDES